MSRTFLGGCVILVAVGVIAPAAAGCYTGGDVTTRGGRTTVAPPTAVEPTEPASASSVTGVPCDVAQVLAKDCASCHAATPVGGAPNALMSYDDLMAASVTDVNVSAAQMSLTRMKDPKSPMPPDGAPAEDLAVLQQWIAAGMPKGTDAACDATPAANIYATDPVCSSKTEWTSGDHGSKSMRPGGACNKCHDMSAQAPSYDAAGTIYKTAHEPDDCNGINNASAKVIITDADGMTHTATVNSVGNFYFTDSIKMPYKAKVANGSKTRSMSSAQKDGDCNKCHTEAGIKKAPGRIMAP